MKSTGISRMTGGDFPTAAEAMKTNLHVDKKPVSGDRRKHKQSIPVERKPSVELETNETMLKAKQLGSWKPENLQGQNMWDEMSDDDIDFFNDPLDFGDDKARVDITKILEVAKLPAKVEEVVKVEERLPSPPPPPPPPKQEAPPPPVAYVPIRNNTRPRGLSDTSSTGSFGAVSPNDRQGFIHNAGRHETLAERRQSMDRPLSKKSDVPLSPVRDVPEKPNNENVYHAPSKSATFVPGVQQSVSAQEIEKQQRDIMIQARERARKRREEEERLEREARERRAAEKLRELEAKLALKKETMESPVQPPIVPPSPTTQPATIPGEPTEVPTSPQQAQKLARQNSQRGSKHLQQRREEQLRTANAAAAAIEAALMELSKSTGHSVVTAPGGGVVPPPDMADLVRGGSLSLSGSFKSESTTLSGHHPRKPSLQMRSQVLGTTAMLRSESDKPHTETDRVVPLERQFSQRTATEAVRSPTTEAKNVPFQPFKPKHKSVDFSALPVQELPDHSKIQEILKRDEADRKPEADKTPTKTDNSKRRPSITKDHQRKKSLDVNAITPPQFEYGMNLRGPSGIFKSRGKFDPKNLTAEEYEDPRTGRWIPIQQADTPEDQKDNQRHARKISTPETSNVPRHADRKVSAPDMIPESKPKKETVTVVEALTPPKPTGVDHVPEPVVPVEPDVEDKAEENGNRSVTPVPTGYVAVPAYMQQQQPQQGSYSPMMAHMQQQQPMMYYPMAIPTSTSTDGASNTQAMNMMMAAAQGYYAMPYFLPNGTPYYPQAYMQPNAQAYAMYAQQQQQQQGGGNGTNMAYMPWMQHAAMMQHQQQPQQAQQAMERKNSNRGSYRGARGGNSTPRTSTPSNTTPSTSAKPTQDKQRW